jgi:hypothetical protein
MLTNEIEHYMQQWNYIKIRIAASLRKIHISENREQK